MTSVTSRGLSSPAAPLNLDLDPALLPDPGESWYFLGSGAGAGPGILSPARAPSTIGFLSTPESGSMGDFAFVGRMPRPSAPQSPPAAVSPLQLSMERQHAANFAGAPFPSSQYRLQAGAVDAGFPLLSGSSPIAAYADADFLDHQRLEVAPTPGVAMSPILAYASARFSTFPQQQQTQQQQQNGMAADVYLSAGSPADCAAMMDPDMWMDIPLNLDPPGMMHDLALLGPDWIPTDLEFDFLQPYMSSPDGSLHNGHVEEDSNSANRTVVPESAQCSPTSPLGVTLLQPPLPPPLQPPPPPPPPPSEPSRNNAQAPLRNIRSGRVSKKRPPPEAAPRPNQFVVITPTSIARAGGRPNRYDGADAIQSTQKGRRGPLPLDIRENALEVRRRGACFCCHIRKVKCDKERPCRNCAKLATQLPLVICWQFPDFLPVLFPAFLRAHFRKEEVARFLDENVASLLVDGAVRPCQIKLTSGSAFQTTLSVAAQFFVPKSDEVMRHWHQRTGGPCQVTLDEQRSVPVGLDLGTGPQQEALRKRVQEYVQALLGEAGLVDQLTNGLRGTDVPTKILRIVHNYANRSQSAMVRKALAIYTMHYVMTRHLCLTWDTVASLAGTVLVPQHLGWVTSRILNRQIKAVLDELMQKGMQTLFEAFAKSLKEKSRREWAPCMASFLLMCLFMESVKVATDTFIIAENEISLRRTRVAVHKRGVGLKSIEQVENLPFRQFAYQFHQVFQTYSRDATSRPFNPLVDDSHLTQADLDGPGQDMVLMLRALMRGQSWYELDLLTVDPMPGSTGQQEEHPFPREVANDYQGRLVSKFLLSFQNEKYVMSRAAA